MKNKVKCPHCGKSRYIVPAVAINNATNYGGGYFNVICNKCGEPIKVYLERRVVLTSIEKGNRNALDFPIEYME